MLAQMREPGVAGRLVLRADMHEDLEAHDRRRVILVQQRDQSVRQLEACVRERANGRGGLRCSSVPERGAHDETDPRAAFPKCAVHTEVGVGTTAWRVWRTTYVLRTAAGRATPLVALDGRLVRHRGELCLVFCSALRKQIEQLALHREPSNRATGRRDEERIVH